MRVDVKGAKQLDQIAKVLATKGNSRALKRRMVKAFKRAAEPITRDQVRNLARDLPHSGGAAATISAGARTTVRTGWAAGTVDILDRWPGHDIAAIDRGILRHPTFERRLSLFSRNPLAGGAKVGGRMGEWHVTKVKPELLTRAFLEHKKTVQAELLVEMRALAAEIARET